MSGSTAVSLSAVVDAFGITAPDYPTVLSTLTNGFRSIYGQDAYLEPDSQDGALLAIFALALHDTSSMAIAVFNQFSPATSQGEGLSSVVKINGIAREVPSASTVDVLVTGQVGTVITNGIVVDAANNRWYLNATVIIGNSGAVTATATAGVPGALVAAPGSLTIIGSPTRGWQTVSNPASATPGAVVETDAKLRVRQAASTALPSQSILDGMIGALLGLPNVTRLAAYENDTSLVDVRGIPAHTVSFVVDGGDAQTVANTIGAKKAPGVGTFGTTSQTVTDVYAIPQAIRFFRPTVVPIQVSITATAFPGYTALAGTTIQAAVAAYITGLAIAAPVLRTRLYVPIDAVASTFNVTNLTLARKGGTLAGADVVLLFNEAASCLAADVALIVLA